MTDCEYCGKSKFGYDKYCNRQCKYFANMDRIIRDYIYYPAVDSENQARHDVLKMMHEEALKYKALEHDNND